jgi:hypothetical protein
MNSWIEIKPVLEARIAHLEALLKETVPNLTRIIRMPNAEYVADAHNKALERLTAALDTKG